MSSGQAAGTGTPIREAHGLLRDGTNTGKVVIDIGR